MSEAAESGALELVSPRSLRHELKNQVFVLLDFAVLRDVSEEQTRGGFISAAYGIEAEFDSVGLVDGMNFQLDLRTSLDMNLVRFEIIFFGANFNYTDRLIAVWNLFSHHCPAGPHEQNEYWTYASNWQDSHEDPSPF